MKKIILMYVFSFIAISAMCQKMESGSSVIDGKPAAPKPAAAVSSKAYAGYVAPAAVPKQATPAEQAKKNVEKSVVLPASGNLGTAPVEQVTQNTDPAAAKVEGTSFEAKQVKPVVESKQVTTGPSSTDAAPKTEAKPKAKVGSN